MNPTRPFGQEKLLTLQEASQKLGVSPEVLLSWNDYQILKPTITVTGHIGYTPQQIEQFLHIYEAFRPLQPQPTPITSAMQSTPTASSSSLSSPASVIAATPSSFTLPLSLPSTPPHHSAHSLRFVSTLFAMCIAVTIGIITQQERLTSLLNQFETSYQKTHSTSQVASSSNLSLNSSSTVAFSNSENNNEALGKSIQGNNESAFAQKQENAAPPTQTPTSTTVSNKRDTVPMATVAGVMKALIGAKTPAGEATQRVIQDVSTFASTITRPTGTAIPNSPFDKSGNIAGLPHTDILAMSYTNPDISGTYQNGVLNNSLRNQLILIAIAAAGTLLYMFKRPKKQAEGPISRLSNTSAFSEKVLELDQKMDGTVVVYYNSKAYKISKPELHSDSDQFIERLMNLYKPGSKEMEYDSATDSLKLTAPLSRLVTRLGFVGVKRDVFFPRTAKHSVLFRKYITREDLDIMKIKVNEILSDLTPIS